MKLTVIGFGHMGSAIVDGALRAGILDKNDITVCDKLPEAAKRAAELGIKINDDPKKAVDGAEAVLLAVKPADLEDCAKNIAEKIPENAVVISICAGKKLETIGNLFPGKKAVRVMPNTPALVGEGMSGVCGNGLVSDQDLENVLKIFRSFGRAETVPEELFDCVTAVSGSGPAYVYSFIIALEDYAKNRGMTEDQARLFAAQTVLGSAKMVLESGDTPKDLKQKICTPNGTTVEAVKVLESRGFEGIIADAAAACEARSKELGR